MVICRRVFNLNEIATWFDRLTMSGYAPRNDMRETERPCLRHQGLFKVMGINHPLVLSLSKDGRRWFDKLTMSGGRRTLKRPCFDTGIIPMIPGP